MPKKQTIDDAELSRRSNHATIKGLYTNTIIGVSGLIISALSLLLAASTGSKDFRAFFAKNSSVRVVPSGNQNVDYKLMSPVGGRPQGLGSHSTDKELDHHYHVAQTLLLQHKPLAAKSELRNILTAKPTSVEALRDYCIACENIDAADATVGVRPNFINLHDMLEGYERLSEAASGQPRYARLRKVADETIPQLRELLRKYGG